MLQIIAKFVEDSSTKMGENEQKNSAPNENVYVCISMDN